MTKAGFANKISFRSGYGLNSKGIVNASIPPPPPPPLYIWTEGMGMYMIPYTTLGTIVGEQKVLPKAEYMDMYMISFTTLQTIFTDKMQYPVFNQTYATYSESVNLSFIPYGTASASVFDSTTLVTETVTLTS